MKLFQNIITVYFFHKSVLTTLAHLLPIITLDGRTRQIHNWEQSCGWFCEPGWHSRRTAGGTEQEHKKVVRFLLHYLRWNVDDALLARWVKDLIGVGLILPSLRTVLLSLAPHPVVER